MIVRTRDAEPFGDCDLRFRSDTQREVLRHLTLRLGEGDSAVQQLYCALQLASEGGISLSEPQHASTSESFSILIGTYKVMNEVVLPEEWGIRML